MVQIVFLVRWSVKLKAFAECDGSKEVAPGVYAGQQNRKPFGFCYRSLIGNDTEGTDYGYKLHLVYGCLASPSEGSHSTINDSPEAGTMGGRRHNANERNDFIRQRKMSFSGIVTVQNLLQFSQLLSIGLGGIHLCTISHSQKSRESYSVEAGGSSFFIIERRKQKC